MTCIVNYPTKKAFREACASAPKKIWLEDPSVFIPYSGSLMEYVHNNGTTVVTNHPKRSWYAQVSQDGSVRV